MSVQPVSSLHSRMNMLVPCIIFEGDALHWSVELAHLLKQIKPQERIASCVHVIAFLSVWPLQVIVSVQIKLQKGD